MKILSFVSFFYGLINLMGQTWLTFSNVAESWREKGSEFEIEMRGYGGGNNKNLN